MGNYRRLPILYFALVVVLFAPVPSLAEDRSAEAFLRDIYKLYEKSSVGIDLRGRGKAARYFTPALAQLIDQDAADAAKPGGIGRLTFDPFVAGREWVPTKVKIEVVPGDKPGIASGTATFKPQGETELCVVKLDLVETPDGWRISDIHWQGQDDSLSDILSSKE
jgi:hypothetical protein